MTAFDKDAAAQRLAARLPGLAVEVDVPLAKKTTFGIGGPADLLVSPSTEAELLGVLAWARDEGVPWFLLGGGSNLLVGDLGVRGCVLQLVGELAAIRVEENGDVIAVGAGAKFPRLTRVALDLGWPPAVGWMGTPGQVGGALKMNAGTRDGEIGDVVIEVSIATPDHVERISREGCGFGYRTSRFPTRAVLTSAILRCDVRRIDEAAALDAHAKDLLKRRHATQPTQRSAGSLFKNPPGDYAGRLIEQAGLKGYTVGGAQISEVHANFVVNLGGASAADVVAVADHAQAEVKRRFGVELEWEVRRVGEFTGGAPAGEGA